ncbi:TPA: hypothetical protein ACH3X2_002354 [Trebouxia sp. C0005]
MGRLLPEAGPGVPFVPQLWGCCLLFEPRLQVPQVQDGVLLPPAPLRIRVPGMFSPIQCLHWPLLGAGLGGRLGVL